MLMSLARHLSLFRLVCNVTSSRFTLRNMSRCMISRNYVSSSEPIELGRFSPLFQSVRFKSKNKISKGSGIQKFIVISISQGCQFDR